MSMKWKYDPNVQEHHLIDGNAILQKFNRILQNKDDMS